MFCVIEWCDKTSDHNEMCNGHYLQMRRWGFVPEPKFCLSEGCEKQLRRDNTTGYCKPHYIESWHRENPERVKETKSQWYQENKDNLDPLKLRESAKKWQRNNPEKVRVIERRRRARKKEAFVEDVLKPVVWERDSGICFLCNQSADESRWDLAHIVPLSRGGEHSYANTAVSHPRCNNFQLGRLVEELDLDTFLLTLERG